MAERITNNLIKGIEKDLENNLLDKDNISLNEIITKDILTGIDSLNHLFTTNKDYQPKKGHKNVYYDFTSEKQKENIILGYKILEKLREKITGETIFYINVDRNIKINKPFEFQVLFKDGNVTNKFSHSGIKMDKIPETINDVKKEIETNDKIKAQEIIENRLRFIQNFYLNNEQNYYTVYGKEGKTIEIENTNNVKSFEKNKTLIDIYNNQRYHKEIQRKMSPAQRWGEYIYRSSKGYLVLENGQLKIIRDSDVSSQLFAIAEINKVIYLTALGGKNKGQLLEAQLHAASTLKTDGGPETLLTKYSKEKVISFDEAMIRASGNLSFYRGGDVTFYINGQFYTYQVKGIRGEVKINTIINGIKKLYNIFSLDNNKSLNLEDLLSQKGKEKVITEIEQLFSIYETEMLDTLAVDMMKNRKIKII